MHATDVAYLQSRETDWQPFGKVNTDVGKVVACGDSPLVSYDGTPAFTS